MFLQKEDIDSAIFLKIHVQGLKHLNAINSVF